MVALVVGRCALRALRSAPIVSNVGSAICSIIVVATRSRTPRSHRRRGCGRSCAMWARAEPGITRGARLADCRRAAPDFTPGGRDVAWRRRGRAAPSPRGALDAQRAHGRRAEPSSPASVVRRRTVDVAPRSRPGRHHRRDCVKRPSQALAQDFRTNRRTPQSATTAPTTSKRMTVPGISGLPRVEHRWHPHSRVVTAA
jgi:hypothetical protein